MRSPARTSAGTPLTVAFKTFGCKVNCVESEQAAADLVGRGVRLVAEDEAAVIVINTCTVTAEADRKARKAVRHAHALAHAPVVVATGCLAVAGAVELAGLGERVVVEADRTRVAARVAELLGTGAHPAPQPVRAGERFRTRVPVKVADGCDAFCAYCIVPYVRGASTVVPLPDVVAEVDRLVEGGVSEVVLTGINIGRADLAALVEAVASTGVPRIRISSIEPLHLTDRLLGVLSAIPALCSHLHVPLQSGSDRILSAMGRTYTLEAFERRIAAARAALPGLAVTTDVMAGFPTETAQDAAATAEACERLGFSRLHVFRYSPRKPTRAAKMTGRVPPGEVAARAAALRAVDARLRDLHAGERLGGVAEVLVEDVSQGRATGTSEDYLKVRMDDARRSVGEIVSVRLTRYEHDGFLGEAL